MSVAIWPEDYDGMNEIIALVKKAKDFDAIENILYNELGVDEEFVISIYRSGL